MGFADRLRGLWSARSGVVPDVASTHVVTADMARSIPADVIRDIAFLRLDGRLDGGDDPLRANVTVFRCAMLIADLVSRLPMCVYRGETKLDTHPLAALLARPHPLMPSGRFVQTLVLHMLVHGQAFVFKDGEKSTRICDALKLLPPDRVDPIRPNRDLYELSGWRVSGTAKDQVFAPELVIRIEYAPDPADPLKGLSPIGVARTTAGADVEAARLNNALLKNGGIPPLVLKYMGKGQITPAQKAEYLRQWDERHSGAENAGRPAFATGDWDVIKLGMDAKDMQFLQGRAWNLKEICRAFGVDPWFLGEHDAGALSRSDSMERRRHLYQSVVIPLATRIALTLTAELAVPIERGLSIVFDTDGVEALREDTGEKLAHAKLFRDLGFTVNAVNEKLELGMDPVPGGDVPLVQSGMIPLEDVVAPAPEVSAGAAEMPEGGVPAAAETTVLNGAQIAAAVSIVQAVSSGQMPRDSAVGLLVTLFHVSTEQAETMLGSAGTGATTQPNIPEGGAVVDVKQPTETLTAEPDRAWRPTPDRLRMWRAYVRRTEPIERKMHAALRRNLMAQRAKVLDALDGGARARGKASSAFDPEEFAKAMRPTVLAAHGEGERSAVDDMQLTTEAPLKGAATRAEDYYTERFPMLRGTGEYVRSRLESTISEGISNGENLSDLKDRVRETLNDSVRHARTVARTEVATATSIARSDMFRRNGVKSLEWLSAGDDNVRESHQIDGSVAKDGKPFSNGLLYPNDPSGPPEETVNCRCVAMPGPVDDAETNDDEE